MNRKFLSNHLMQVLAMLILCLLAIVCGAITGCLTALFGRVLLAVEDFRTEHLVFTLPFLALAGLIIVFCYKKFGKGSEQGMGLVFDAVNGKADKIPLRLIPMVIISTWLTHLCGGSAGREGVAVQLGATVSHNIAQKIKPLSHISECKEILTIAGMSAGFSGLFHTPISAVLFALEVIAVGRLQYKALLPSALASASAYIVSILLGLETFSFDVSAPEFSFSFSLVLLGLAFGLTGGLFAFLQRKFKKIFAGLIKNPLLRVAVVGAGLSVLLFICGKGRYSGLGTNLINDALNSNQVYPADFILKLLFTVVTLSVGFQGGEVTPLFAIGATLGAVLSPLLGVPVVLGVAMGYCAVFGSATNTLFAPVFIGAEVFGFQNIPYFAIVCLLAFLFNGNRSIYGKQTTMTRLTSIIK